MYELQTELDLSMFEAKGVANFGTRCTNNPMADVGYIWTAIFQNGHH